MSFTPVTKKELKLAIEDYIKNNNKEKYKIINEWDVSNIQDMEGLFENYNEFDDDIYNVKTYLIDNIEYFFENIGF
jgi:hypothetical protein